MRFSLWMASIKQTAIIDTDVDWMLWYDSSHSSNSLFSWSMTTLVCPAIKFHQCIVLSDKLLKLIFYPAERKLSYSVHVENTKHENNTRFQRVRLCVKRNRRRVILPRTIWYNENRYSHSLIGRRGPDLFFYIFLRELPSSCGEELFQQFIRDLSA